MVATACANAGLLIARALFGIPLFGILLFAMMVAYTGHHMTPLILRVRYHMIFLVVGQDPVRCSAADVIGQFIK